MLQTYETKFKSLEISLTIVGETATLAFFFFANLVHFDLSIESVFVANITTFLSFYLTKYTVLFFSVSQS